MSRDCGGHAVGTEMPTLPPEAFHSEGNVVLPHLDFRVLVTELEENEVVSEPAMPGGRLHHSLQGWVQGLTPALPMAFWAAPAGSILVDTCLLSLL